MISIKPGTPGYDGYQAAIGDNDNCPHDIGTQEREDWLIGFLLAMEDMKLLEALKSIT